MNDFEVCDASTSKTLSPSLASPLRNSVTVRLCALDSRKKGYGAYTSLGLLAFEENKPAVPPPPPSPSRPASPPRPSSDHLLSPPPLSSRRRIEESVGLGGRPQMGAGEGSVGRTRRRRRPRRRWEGEKGQWEDQDWELPKDANWWKRSLLVVVDNGLTRIPTELCTPGPSPLRIRPRNSSLAPPAISIRPVLPRTRQLHLQPKFSTSASKSADTTTTLRSVLPPSEDQTNSPIFDYSPFTIPPPSLPPQDLTSLPLRPRPLGIRTDHSPLQQQQQQQPYASFGDLSSLPSSYKHHEDPPPAFHQPANRDHHSFPTVWAPSSNSHLGLFPRPVLFAGSATTPTFKKGGGGSGSTPDQQICGPKGWDHFYRCD